MKYSYKLYYFIISAVIYFGCKQQPREIKTDKTNKTAENMIAVNKYLVGQDVDKIKGYISRRNWKMENSATGLYYRIIEQGKGRKIQTGDTLKINYKVSLLDGTLCYSSNEDGPKTFVAGKGQIEPGMEEGILLLHDGAKACFILMPHLAHGLIGDGKRIPARATIVYDIQLIQINNKHDIN